MPRFQRRSLWTINRRSCAVFFDRHGRLNVDHGFIRHAEQFEWISGAIAAIARRFEGGDLDVFVSAQLPRSTVRLA